MREPDRVLLTGATGFIGGHLARRLVGLGREVHAVVREGSAPLPEGVTPHLHDGTTASLLDIVGAVQPDVTFHLASLFLARHTAADVEPLVASNVLFGTQLLEALSSLPAPRLVNVGTGWQHHSGPGYDPVSLYAATKQAFEDIAAYYATQGLAMVTLRLYDTYGPSDPRLKVVPLLLRAARTGERLEMSPGEQTLHLVYIDDVVDAFLAAAGLVLDAAPGSTAVYAVDAPEPVTLRELVAHVARVTGREMDVAWGARPYREREVMVPWIGERLPGWSPRTSLDEGLRRMLETPAPPMP